MTADTALYLQQTILDLLDQAWEQHDPERRSQLLYDAMVMRVTHRSVVRQNVLEGDLV